MISLTRAVFEKQWSAAIVADEYIQASVVIEIANCEAAGRIIALKGGAGLIGNVDKLASLLVKQEQRLLVLHLQRVIFDHVIGMAVGEEQIDEAVIIVIEKFQSPAA